MSSDKIVSIVPKVPEEDNDDVLKEVDEVMDIIKENGVKTFIAIGWDLDDCFFMGRVNANNANIFLLADVLKDRVLSQMKCYDD